MVFTKIRNARWLLLAAVTIFLVATPAAWACPNCKDALAGDASHGGLVEGLFWSILFLLSMPFLIVAGLSSYFYYLVRRARHTATLSGKPSALRDRSTSPFSIPPAGTATAGAAGAPRTADESLEVAEV